MSEPLRPSGVGELLDRAFSIYRSNFVLLVATVFIPYGIELVSSLLTPNRIRWTIPQLLIGLVVHAFAAGGVISVAAAAYLGEKADFKLAMRASQRHFGRLLATNVGVAVMIGIGCVLLLIPGLIWMAGYAVAPAACVLENAGMREAMRRSKTLADGFRWRMFLVFTAFAAVTWSLMLGIKTVGLLAAGAVSAHGFLALAKISPAISVPVNLLIAPLEIIAFVLLYFDLRIRKEGFDVELLLQRAQTAAPAPASAP